MYTIKNIPEETLKYHAEIINSWKNKLTAPDIVKLGAQFGMLWFMGVKDGQKDNIVFTKRQVNRIIKAMDKDLSL